MNPAARSLLAWHHERPPSADRLQEMLPEEFFAATMRDGDLSACLK